MLVPALGFSRLLLDWPEGYHNQHPMLVLPIAIVSAAVGLVLKSLHSTPHAGACFRFGGLLHDWPESYFEAQQSRGVGLAGIFKQAIGQQQAYRAKTTRNVLARMFPTLALAKMGTQVSSCHSSVYVCPAVCHLSACLSVHVHVPVCVSLPVSCLKLQHCIQGQQVAPGMSCLHQGDPVVLCPTHNKLPATLV